MDLIMNYSYANYLITNTVNDVIQMQKSTHWLIRDVMQNTAFIQENNEQGDNKLCMFYQLYTEANLKGGARAPLFCD